MTTTPAELIDDDVLAPVTALVAPKVMPKIAPGLPPRAAAFEYGKAGIKIIPCVQDGKQPATPNGFHDATTDLRQIDAWWTENPHFNIGLSPEDAGWAVVDIDPGGEAAWLALVHKEGGHEPTYEVSTPRGGRHLYFAGSIPTSASKIGVHVDTRGVGGYVVAPPSIVGGKPYKVVNDLEPAPLPAWMPKLLAAKSAAREAATDVEQDTVANVARAVSTLKADVAKNDEPRIGEGSDARTYAMAAMCRDLGVSEDRTAELLHTVWAPRFDRDWIADKVRHVWRYAQNEPGVDAVVGTAAETFGPAIEKLAANVPANENTPTDLRKSRFWPKWFSEFKNEPEGEWLVQHLVLDGSTGIWAGHKGSLKSTALLNVALAVATGKPAFGRFIVNRTGPVAWVAGEDAGSLRPRIEAWRKQFSHDGEPPIARLDAMPKSTSDTDWNELCEVLDATMPAGGWRLIVLDTVSKSIAGEDENSAATMAGFATRMDMLRRRYGCTVIAVAHKAKSTDGQTLSSRGSDALLADTESGVNCHAIKIDANGKAETVELNFERFKIDPTHKLQLAVKSVEVGRRKDGTPVEGAVLLYDPALVAQQAAARKQNTSLARSVLNCLSWFSGWKRGEKCEVSTGELATALMRSKMWTEEPEMPGAAAPENVLRAPLTAEETAARRVLQINVTRLARQWSKHPEYRHVVAKSQTSPEWVFRAHAAARLETALANEGREA